MQRLRRVTLYSAELIEELSFHDVLHELLYLHFYTLHHRHRFKDEQSSIETAL